MKMVIDFPKMIQILQALNEEGLLETLKQWTAQNIVFETLERIAYNRL